MKKRIIIFVLLLLSISYTNAAVTAIDPGHSSEQVYIKYLGKYVTLQKAIDSTSMALVSSYDSLPTDRPYHLASQILITTTNGYKMSLQEAIDNKIFLKGATQSYTATLSPGSEYANSINVKTITGVMSLQDAINQNKLSYVYACDVNVGKACPFGTDSSCVNTFGVIQCDGSCLGASFIAKGTACGSSWYTCNGTGYCRGWSGTGCSGCPFGSRDINVREICTLNGYQGYYSYWTYEETHGAICEVKDCCAKFIICWDWCWKDTSWRVRP